MSKWIAERKIVELRGLFGIVKVEALVHGAFAAHRQIGLEHLWCVTLLPLGLSLPPVWASFETEAAAARAMRLIAGMRNDWHRVAQADLTKQLAARLKEICAACGARRGPITITQSADEGPLGTKCAARLNGHHAPDARRAVA